MSKRAPPSSSEEQQKPPQKRQEKSDLVQLLPELIQEDAMPSLDSRTTTRSAKLRAVVGICFLLALAGMLYLGYFCPDHVCALTSRDPKEPARLSEASILSGTETYFLFTHLFFSGCILFFNFFFTISSLINF